MSKIDVEQIGQENLASIHLLSKEEERAHTQERCAEPIIKQHGQHSLVVLQHLVEALQVHRVPTSEDRRRTCTALQ
jgi:hypothetical protein